MVYKVTIPEMKYERIQAFETYEEARDFLAERHGDGTAYTIVQE